MSLYLGNNLVSGVATPTEPTRNLGQIIESLVPLTDAGLHLLDGALINGSGIYSAFVGYMADLYNELLPEVETVYNVNIVGSLTNTDGVLSGFSTSNYALLPRYFPSSLSTEDWEFVIPYKTTSLSSSQYPMCSNDYGIGFMIDTNGKLIWYISSNGTSWNIASAVSSTLTVQANTQYYFKLGHIKSSNTTFLDVSTDKENYTRYLSVSMSVAMQDTRFKFGISRSNVNPAVDGLIDLNESYINVNGSRWWTGTSQIMSCFCTEAEWQTSVTTYGVCGKFVYDSVNNTVRLPKITGKIEGTTDLTALGELAEQYVKLPNITGTIGNLINWSTTSSGAFSDISSETQYWHGGSGNIKTANFDASRSSSVYSGNGSDTKIHEQAIKVLYYIVIATTTKTEIEVDIDEIATDLNGKADVDLSNVNNTGYIKMAKASMPSDTYDDLTLGASGTTYTAPADGWFRFVKASTDSSDWIAGWNVGKVGTRNIGSIAGENMGLFVPVSKGDIFQAQYRGNGSVIQFKFMYAVGSESEAS